MAPDEQNNIDIYKTNRLATVNITSIVYQRDFFFQVFPQKGIGSGFIINEDGEIVTNNHVVSGSRNVTVTLSDKKQYPATVLGIDRRSDLAILQDSTPTGSCRSSGWAIPTLWSWGRKCWRSAIRSGSKER